ncbi:MAG: hypothetical protein H6834_05060 [Planctomycetes bacterium]|nr:hypothetical protein [Planctomycetota bacterium]
MATKNAWNLTLLAWTLGALFLLTIAMSDVAAGNFKLTNPDELRNASEVFSEIPAGTERAQDLRYVASELNRYFFLRYNFAHVVLVGLALGFYHLGSWRSKITHVCLLFFAALSLANLFYFTPTLVEWGREIDFVPRDPRPPEVSRFYMVHGINIVLELLKLVMILFVTFRVARAKVA